MIINVEQIAPLIKLPKTSSQDEILKRLASFLHFSGDITVDNIFRKLEDTHKDAPAKNKHFYAKLIACFETGAVSNVNPVTEPEKTDNKKSEVPKSPVETSGNVIDVRKIAPLLKLADDSSQDDILKRLASFLRFTGDITVDNIFKKLKDTHDSASEKNKQFYAKLIACFKMKPVVEPTPVPDPIPVQDSIPVSDPVPPVPDEPEKPISEPVSPKPEIKIIPSEEPFEEPGTNLNNKEILKKIFSADNSQDIVRYINILSDKCEDPKQFEDFCGLIEREIGIKRKAQKIVEAFFAAGEKYLASRSYSKAYNMFEKAVGESEEPKVYYRMGSMIFHKQVGKRPENADNAQLLLQNYYDFSLNEQNEMYPEAFLEAAKISFSMGESCLEQSMDYLRKFIYKTQGIKKYSELFEEAKILLSDYETLSNAKGNAASAEEKYAAALVCASMAESAMDNKGRYMFEMPADYFISSVEKFMSEAYNAVQDVKIKEELSLRIRKYAEIRKLLENKGHSFEAEFKLGNLYFELQYPFFPASGGNTRYFRGIDEAIRHMNNAAAIKPENELVLSRLRFFSVFKKCSKTNASEDDIIELSEEYRKQARESFGTYEKALSVLFRIKDTHKGKENLFDIYYSNLSNYDEAEKYAKELVEEEKEQGRSTYYQEALIRIYCKNKKFREARELCKGLLDLPASSGAVPYSYAQLCEMNGDMGEAKEYYEKSAGEKYNYPPALYRLFQMEYDKNVDKYLIKDLLDRAADLGNSNALYQRALFRINGNSDLGIKQNPTNNKKGMDDLLQAAKQGHSDAAVRLLEIYLKNEKNEKSEARTKKIVDLLKCLKNVNMSPDDQNLIPAECMPSGKKDDNAIIDEMPQDLDDKIIFLAENLLTGTKSFPKDIQSAMDLLTYCGDNPKACSLLGEIYYFGINEKLPDENIARFQRKSYFSDKYPVQRNLRKAEDLLKIAYTGGDKWASYNYALLLIEKGCRNDSFLQNLCSESGLINAKCISGLKKDGNEKIIDLLNEASRTVAQSKYILGFLYENGKTTLENPTQAKNCYEDAADKHFVPAMIKIAEQKMGEEFYYLGRYWYMEALVQGSSYAISALSEEIDDLKDKEIIKIFTADGVKPSNKQKFLDYSLKLMKDNPEIYPDPLKYVIYLLTRNEDIADSLSERKWQKRADKASDSVFEELAKI